MIRVTPSLSLPDSEVQLEFVRASGPGGQNVNKVATAVQLRFDAAHSPSLPEDVRAGLLRLSGLQLTGAGVLLIDARRHRTQARNREDALARLVAVLRRAAAPPTPRTATRVPKGVKEQRLEAKRRQSQRKQLRRGGPPAE